MIVVVVFEVLPETYPNKSQYTHSRFRMTHTSTKCRDHVDNLIFVFVRCTCFIGTVADTETKIGVAAEARIVSGTATKTSRLSKHIRDTVLLLKRQDKFISHWGPS